MLKTLLVLNPDTCAVAAAAAAGALLQGGSMPPEAAAWLQQLQAQGLLCVRQHAGVSAAEWDWQAGRWDVYLEVSWG